MALRRTQGFTRYALSVQYHGGLLLGFARQGVRGEDCILPDGTDLRGLRTVEGRIRDALAVLVGGDDNYENFMGSSRTDRGVHALMNTCQVDIRPRRRNGAGAAENKQHRVSLDSTSGNNEWIPHDESVISSERVVPWDPQRIKQGLNYHLTKSVDDRKRKRLSSMAGGPMGDASWLWSHYHRSVQSAIRILNVVPAPLTSPNKFYTGRPGCAEPPVIDWNVRFSAVSRTYVYRILHMTGNERDHLVPFDHDRSWRLTGDAMPLDVDDMNEAGRYLVGTHDFTSFRGKQCQRTSPVVTLRDVHVAAHRYVPPGGSMESLACRGSDPLHCFDDLARVECDDPCVRLYTVAVTGESFLYRQVLNIVGCLVNVGQKKLRPETVRDILEKRDRRVAPAMAPAHGLFLVNVDHGDLKL